MSLNRQRCDLRAAALVESVCTTAHLNDQYHWNICVSGTLTSITNLATSLARNMDRLSLDEEHYTRQEEWRRQLPESLGDGLRQGLSRLGISLLGEWGSAHNQIHEVLLQHGEIVLVPRYREQNDDFYET